MIARTRRWIIGSILVALVGVSMGLGLARVGRDLGWTRPALATFARIVAAANAGDLDSVRQLCTDRYRVRHPIEAAPGGGVVGLPRQVHPNYRIWIDGTEVRLCPANRVGIVYRLVRTRQAWRLDGVAGMLGPDGRVVAIDEGDEDRPGGPENR